MSTHRINETTERFARQSRDRAVATDRPAAHVGVSRVERACVLAIAVAAALAIAFGVGWRST